MQLHIKKLTGKLGFLAAIAAAAVIGGVSTGVVMASIPDSNGNLQTCYRNNGGDLRVIDTATQTCANNETALNLTQTIDDASTAAFVIKNGAVQTASLRGVLDYEPYEGSNTNWPPYNGYCLKLAISPNFSTVSDVRGRDDSTDDFLDDICGTDFNVFVNINTQPNDLYDPGNSQWHWFSE